MIDRQRKDWELYEDAARHVIAELIEPFINREHHNGNSACFQNARTSVERRCMDINLRRA